VDFDIEAEWQSWMKNEFIPQVLITDGFEGYKFLKIMSDEEQNGASYALQYTVRSMNDLLNYQSGMKKQLYSDLKAKWGEACLNFATLMEICDEG
jgi:hypothetical protein